MDLVDGNGSVQGISVLPLLHPLLIRPLVREIPYDGGGARRFFVKKTEGIRFVDYASVMLRDDMELINGTISDSGNEPLPDAGTSTGAQRMGTVVPSVEAANDCHLARVRSPNAETCALLAANRSEVGTQLFIGAVMAAFVEKVDVLLAQETDLGTGTQSTGWSGFRH